MSCLLFACQCSRRSFERQKQEYTCGANLVKRGPCQMPEARGRQAGKHGGCGVFAGQGSGLILVEALTLELTAPRELHPRSAHLPAKTRVPRDFTASDDDQRRPNARQVTGPGRPAVSAYVARPSGTGGANMPVQHAKTLRRLTLHSPLSILRLPAFVSVYGHLRHANASQVAAAPNE